MDNEKKSFLIHLDSCHQLLPLTMQQRGEVFSALYLFALELNETGGDAAPSDILQKLTTYAPETRMAFSFMAAAVARDYHTWHQKRANYRSAAKRREEGRRLAPLPPGSGVRVYPDEEELRDL